MSDGCIEVLACIFVSNFSKMSENLIKMTLNSIGLDLPRFEVANEETSPHQDLFSPLPLELHLHIARNLGIEDFLRLKKVSRGICNTITAIERIYFRKISLVLGSFCSDLQALAVRFDSRSIKEILRICEKSFFSFLNAVAEKSKIPTFSKVRLACNWLQEPSNQSAFANVQCLDLSHLNLTVFPDQISSCVSLRCLNLSGNQLYFLPSTIGKLKNLFWFFCKQNLLKTIPPEIGGLRKMTILNISDNPLRFLPEEMGKLRGLIWLTLNQSQENLLPPELLDVEELVIDCFEAI